MSVLPVGLNPNFAVVAPRPVEVLRHEGAEALRALAAPLRASGLLPPPVSEMDPEFLAEGFEGDGGGVVVARRGGRAIAYLPYVLRRHHFSLRLGSLPLGGLPFRQLVIFGYAGVDDDHESVLDRLFQPLLAAKGWDVAQIFECPCDSPLARYLSRTPATGFRGFAVFPETYDTLQVDLQPSFDLFLQSRFSKKTRYNLKREVRLLEEAIPGGSTTKVFHSPDQVEDFFGDAERIARRTYQRRLGFNSLCPDAPTKGKMAHLAARGRWRSYILYLNGEPAAYCSATIRWGELWYEVVGYDPRFAKLNPGKVLLYRILEDLHRHRVVSGLNFGKGITGYKELFATSRRPEMNAHIYRNRPYSSLLRSLRSAVNSSYLWLYPRVRHWMPLVKRLYGRGIRASNP
jgi:Acetyltransferase (GNAT) domain